MFALRGIAISFSVFVLVYCTLSLAVSLCWRSLRLRSEKYPVRRTADLLFGLRMFPLITAGVMIAVFTVPSFLLLEPRAIQEPLGDVPFLLGTCGAVLSLVGIWNAGLAMRRASRTISAWTREAQPVESCAAVPVLRISRAVPAMTAAGIIRSRVLLSSVAEFLLTRNELQSALNHEIAHVRRRDNLKKLMLRFVAFPGMAGLESAWLVTTEMAADDAAVSNAGEALDLAAALLKLSRLTPVDPAVELTTALVHSPASVMNARVERLIAWSEERLVPLQRLSPWYGFGALLAMLAVFTVTYTQLLVRMHSATEWLVR